MRDGEHQAGRNPGETGHADFRERHGQQKPRANRREITAAQKKFVEKPFQRGKYRKTDIKSRTQLCALGRPVCKEAAGIDDDGLACAAPDRQVCKRIPGIIETTFTEHFSEYLEFVFAAKIGFTVAGKHFIEKAEPIKLVINGQELVADKKEFSTGSFGWFFNGKISVAVDGKPLSVQVGLNLTVVGSKDAER